MGRSSIGWRRSATSNTVSNDNAEEHYAHVIVTFLPGKSEEQKIR